MYKVYIYHVICVGPMKKTLVDFWRLVWQERPQVIVMVTNLKEGSKNKCEQYWPKSLKEPIAFVGPFTITLLDEWVLPDFAIRRLKIKVNIMKVTSKFFFH